VRRWQKIERKIQEGFSRNLPRFRTGKALVAGGDY
jgi:hypothetical protein